MLKSIVAAAIIVGIGYSLTDARSKGPIFWRGIYLLGIPQPIDNRTFFTHLADSLHLNIFQVRTYGYHGGKERNDFFVGNPRGLRVINNSLVLASLSEQEDSSTHNEFADLIRSETQALTKYANHFRFYLADEPTAWQLEAFASISRRVKSVAGEGSAVTALLGDFESFIREAELSEILVETYVLKNNIPHPSLVNLDEIAANAGIVAWGDTGYGWYFGGLQQSINNELATVVRPAAEVALKSQGKTSLIFVPQLHGLVDSATRKYDRDDDLHSNLLLRPPSPSEIRLQYNLGIAYGAKGFLAFPYGFDAGYDKMAEAIPGLVSGDPSQVDHSSNFDNLFGKQVWTGYAEKWAEVGRMNKRLRSIERTLLRLAWVGAKSWSMEPERWLPAEVTSGNWGDIVIGCSVLTKAGYREDLPQVEIGHLRKGKTDYIVVVNRRCANQDTARITLRLARPVAPTGTRWGVLDIERRKWLPVGRDQRFSDTFDPGEGKIYRITQ